VKLAGQQANLVVNIGFGGGWLLSGVSSMVS